MRSLAQHSAGKNSNYTILSGCLEGISLRISFRVPRPHWCKLDLNLRPPRPERGALSGQRNDNESPSVFANIQSFRMGESVGADPAWLGVRDGNPNNLHVDPGAGRDLISNSQGGARIAAQIQSWLEPTAWATVAFCHHCQDDFRSRLAALVRGPPGTSIPYIFRTMRMSKGRVPGSY